MGPDLIMVEGEKGYYEFTQRGDIFLSTLHGLSIIAPAL